MSFCPGSCKKWSGNEGKGDLYMERMKEFAGSVGLHCFRIRESREAV